MDAIAASFLLLHGLVHGILALVPNPNAPEEGVGTFFSGRIGSWLLTGLGLSESTSKTIASVLAVIATIGFVTVGLALFGILIPIDWWRTLAAASAAVSLLLVVTFWHPYLIVGFLIDVAVIAILIFTDS